MKQKKKLNGHIAHGWTFHFHTSCDFFQRTSWYRSYINVNRGSAGIVRTGCTKDCSAPMSVVSVITGGCTNRVSSTLSRSNHANLKTRRSSLSTRFTAMTNCELDYYWSSDFQVNNICTLLVRSRFIMCSLTCSLSLSLFLSLSFYLALLVFFII